MPLHPSVDMENIDFMNAALNLAKEAAEDGEVPVGAVVTIGNKIVGTGRNRREKGKNALCHAEIEAINNACKRLGDCVGMLNIFKDALTLLGATTVFSAVIFIVSVGVVIFVKGV